MLIIPRAAAHTQGRIVKRITKGHGGKKTLVGRYAVKVGWGRAREVKQFRREDEENPKGIT